jgi:hypothetical protein
MNKSQRDNIKRTFHNVSVSTPEHEEQLQGETLAIAEQNGHIMQAFSLPNKLHPRYTRSHCSDCDRDIIVNTYPRTENEKPMRGTALTEQCGPTEGPYKALRSSEDFNGPYVDFDDEQERLEFLEKPFTSITAPNELDVANAHDLFEFTPANARLLAGSWELLQTTKKLIELVGYMNSLQLGATGQNTNAAAKELIKRIERKGK